MLVGCRASLKLRLQHSKPLASSSRTAMALLSWVQTACTMHTPQQPCPHKALLLCA